MQLASDSPLVSAVPVPTYVEVLRHTITTHDRNISMPACFVSSIAIEGSADEMLVTMAVHHWLRNHGSVESDDSVLAHITRFGQLVYQVTVVKNNLLVQNAAGKKVIAAAYIPNIKRLRVMHAALSNEDVMQFSSMISGLLATTANKRRQWRSRTQTPGFSNARYAVRG